MKELMEAGDFCGVLYFGHAFISDQQIQASLVSA